LSLLVVRVESAYFKKATGRTRFVCEDGARIRSTIGEAILSGEAKTVAATSVGRNEAGVVVAEFTVTWSFKSRKK